MTRKPFLLIALLTAVLAGGLTLAPRTALAGPGGWFCKSGPGSGPRMERMAAILDLNEDQQNRIRAIREAGRQQAAPLLKTLAEERDRLRVLTDAETFDEAAVRALAERHAATRSELIVIRARTRNQIHAVFTPEQRALAEKLRPHRGRGHGRHHGGFY
jgi:protein CpxP